MQIAFKNDSYTLSSYSVSRSMYQTSL